MHGTLRETRFLPALACLCLLGMALPTRASAPAATPAKLPVTRPEHVGVDSHWLRRIDDVVAAGLTAHRMPGCVVLVARHGQVVLKKAYGCKQVAPVRAPMTTNTVFDLASITKPVATATSVMILVERGAIRLRDPVAKHIPAFGQNGKEKITIAQLLTHQGGLIPDNPLADYADGLDTAWKRIFALKPVIEPGTKFVYTDVGFLVLGELVRRVSRKNVHEFSRDHIFQPLGMTETCFVPGERLRQRAAPTQQRDGQWMQGEVHDPRAFRLGGIAGHAGLFSTADDLAVYAQMMLDKGTYRGTRILSRAAVERMTRPTDLSNGLRGLGWDVRTGYSSNRGELASATAFGHGGFTGTVLWIDPGLDLIVIFLSNRVHPSGKGAVNPLVGRIGTVAAAAIDRGLRAPGTAPGSSARGTEQSTARSVLTGIDVLQRDGFALLKGRRVGLITNTTGINRSGVRTVQLLAEAPDVELVALFSPEHGMTARLDTRLIPDGRDHATGLPIYSLYGSTRTPTAERLHGIDTLVFDIQDIGTRFYTYISTMGGAMRAAATSGITFIVLDRPNPIGGSTVAGPVLDSGRESFVGFHRLPVRHAMTVGELARMFRDELRLDLELKIVTLEGWQRGDWFDTTGLLWTNPSPNMRNLTEALLYPGIGLLETTNLSVGRGTDTPFEVLGAPWIDATRLAGAMNDTGLPGVRFVPVVFTPNASKHQNARCGGMNIIVTDRRHFRPVRCGLEIACQLRALYPHEWNVQVIDRLLANRRVLAAIMDGKTSAEMEALYQGELEAFHKRRARYLLYD